MMEQQSSILSEQELHLLASQTSLPTHTTPHQYNSFHVYSYQQHINLIDSTLQVADSVDQLIIMLRASPRGIAVILPCKIQSAQPDSRFVDLLDLLSHRADMRVFWLGPLPSMETDLVTFIHCQDEFQLQQQLTQWKRYLKHLFSDWLKTYRVAFICEDKQQKAQHKADLKCIGLDNIDYFSAQTALTASIKQPLLIIDLETAELHLLNILKQLNNTECFPIVLIYGRLPENVCYAAYTFIENSGFNMLTSLSEIPDKAQWQVLLSALFSKVYLQHWVSEDRAKVNAYKLYDLEAQSVVSYFCAHGISKKQIQALPKTKDIRHIIHANSLNDWFPMGVKREIRLQLADELDCQPYHLDICIEEPENILRTSAFFAGLVMARLKKTKVYWRIEDENSLFADALKVFPISDVILSESLSHQLITETPAVLAAFIKQAQLAHINIIASLPPSHHTREALAWYGIDLVLSAD